MSTIRGDQAVKIMRSPLARARGMGAAKTGVHHWWAMRVTSIALVPLSLYFVVSVLLLEGADQAEMIRYMAEPWNAVLFIALIGILFYHLGLGLQVVIEDYIYDETTKLVALLAMRAGVVLFGLLGLVSVLKLTF